MLALRRSAIVQHFTELEDLEGNGAQVRLDLAKRRYNILKVGNEYIKSIGHTAKFCYADLNCRMKITWGDNSEEFF